jgi:sugar phosphate isomerase/epimerase
VRVTRREFGGASLMSAAALAGGAPLLVAPAAVAPGLRLGLVTYNVARDWDLGTILRLCRESGFEGVEFRTTHAHGVERTLTPAERKDVRRRCADAGILQTSLGSVCEFHSPDPELVKKQVADCREWVLLAKDLGARGVKVRPNGLPREVPEEKTLEQIGRALAECGAFAADHGVEIWVEVHGEGTRLPARMRRIMDVCGHPSVGITWNSNDTDVVDGSVAASFELLRPFIRCAHITDLESSYPYRELFSLMGRAGFSGFTLCEYPRSVSASAGAAWLRAYRARWSELRQDQERPPTA